MHQWRRVLLGKQGTARHIVSQAMIQIANSDMMTFTHMVAFTLPVALVMQWAQNSKRSIRSLWVRQVKAVFSQVIIFSLCLIRYTFTVPYHGSAPPLTVSIHHDIYECIQYFWWLCSVKRRRASYLAFSSTCYPFLNSTGSRPIDLQRETLFWHLKCVYSL